MENINAKELEIQIKETQELLEKVNADQNQIERLRNYKILFGLLALIFLIATIWLLFRKVAPVEKEIDPNYTLVRKDSLKNYKHYYFTQNLKNDINLDSEKIVYYVQIGAFQHFTLSSDELKGINQFKDEDGLNKITIGSFVKYEKAKKLQRELINLEFEDCFLIAKTFGTKIIDIDVALNLSEETQYILSDDEKLD